MATTEELSAHTDEERAEEEQEEEESNGESRRVPPAGESHADVSRKVAYERSPMVGIRNIMTIARRELRGYFDSLIAYVVVCGSLLAVGVWFFYFGFWQVDRATMARMFEGLVSLPVLLSVLVIPLITMRALAEEKRSGTLELLITMPVKDSEVILGKFLGALGLTTVLLLFTLIYPVSMFVWPWHMGALDWGPVWTAYFGLFLFSAAGIAVGMMFSGFTESQIIAFFLTAATLVLLYVVGGVVEYVHGWMGDAIAFISFQSRYNTFARGLIDTRAVVYFVSIAILCLLVAFRSLESRKWS